jgi:MFS family permease
VLGLIAIGLVILAVFAFIEARAKHPIIPLSLFRDRTIAASNLAVFMVMCGMFSAVIFIPRYFQFVRGASATASGYSMWPLLLGLISSSIVSGIVVSRTGRYRLLLVAAMAMLTFGMYLMTHLQADTPTPVMWLWMACVGLGIGPSMSVFTIVIQNAAPRPLMGVATSTMTFVRQIGGVIGLAIAGSLFSWSLTQKLPTELSRAGVPSQITDQFAAHFATNQNNLNVGGDLGRSILNAAPPATRQALSPYVPHLVDGIHNAFALAAADIFWLAVATSVLAFLASLAVREVPLRTQLGADPAAPPRDAQGDVAVPAY